MTLLDIVRTLSMLTWLTVFVLRFREAWRVLLGRGIVGDMEGAIVTAFSFMSICYGMRWYVAVDSVAVYSGLYLFSTLLAGKLVVINIHARMTHGG